MKKEWLRWRWSGCDRDEWSKKHPYIKPFATREEAQAWADAIMKHHSDEFRVIPQDDGFGVEQDVPPPEGNAWLRNSQIS